MLLAIAAIVIGFIILTISADRLIQGAVALAYHIGVAPLLVGLTIVAMGTSAPEMVVSGVAAWLDNNALGVGNALGSNITNIALVLGCAALLAPVTIEHGIIRRELPLLLIISLGMGLLMWDLQLSRLDGVLLLGGFVAFLGWLIYLSQQPQQSASHLKTRNTVNRF